MIISIIGNGNVANQIIEVLNQHHIPTSYIWSRNIVSAKKTANKHNIKLIPSLEEILKTKADLIIISIKDDEIGEFYKNNKTDNLVVHTSGTVKMEALNNLSKRIGVFYPLQTFIKNQQTDWNNIPILVEANSKEDQNMLLKLASVVSNKNYIVNSEQREQIHIGAVVVNNFTNYLASLTFDFLKDKEINFDILKPLFEKTSNNILQSKESPYKNQTGPAKRKDEETISKHIEQLKNYTSLKEIYTIFSNQIIKKETNDEL